MIGRWLRAVAAVAVGLLLVGCHDASSPDKKSASSSSGPTSSATASARLHSPAARACGPPDVPARAVRIATSDGVRLPGFLAGSGARGVVLVHQTDTTAMCGWWSYAARLAGLGYHVLIFDLRCYGDAPCPKGPRANALTTDVAAGVGTLRRAGARHVVLVGASLGGSVVTAAAAAPPVGVTAMAGLSGALLETPMGADRPAVTARSAAPRIRLPTLMAVARDDPTISVTDTQALYASVPATDKRLVVLPASAGHGWDLVLDPVTGDPTSFARTLEAFLAAHL